MPKARVSITLPAHPGDPETSVEVNGQDITHSVRRLSISAGFDEVSSLHLELNPEIMEVDGAEVELSEIPTLVAINERLSAINPKELEDRVLKMPLGDSLSTGEAFLKVLTDMIQSDSDEPGWPEA